MKKMMFLAIGLVYCLQIQAQTVMDIDNNVYNIVTIGNQMWMKENLKTTRFHGGTSINLVTDNTAWTGLSTPGYCFYNNDPANYKETYGALYNWYAASKDSICPQGWTIPTDADWTELSTFLGTESVAGGKMKEAGTSHWISPNTGATNESGFTALPGGYRDVNSSFSSNTSNGRFWSSTGIDNSIAWGRTVFYDSYNLNKSVRDKRFGLSVRCLTPVTGINQINQDDKIKIYPNPAKDKLFIALDNSASNLSYTLSDIRGKVLMINNFPGPAQQSIEIRLTELNNGIYFLRVKNDTFDRTEKIIVNR
jgi:uncharacterized protein (TIGR02145 family)